MYNACSPPKGEQEFGNPQDGSRTQLVPGNSGPGTLGRFPSVSLHTGGDCEHPNQPL